MSVRHLSSGCICRALDVVLALPPEALAALAERIVDRLDQAEPDPDAKPEQDACDGCDDFGTTSLGLNHLVRLIEGEGPAGDHGDAEGDGGPDGGTASCNGRANPACSDRSSCRRALPPGGARFPVLLRPRRAPRPGAVAHD